MCSSDLTGFAEPTCTTSFETDIQREESLLVKDAIHATDSSTLLRGGTKTALPEALQSAIAEAKDNKLEPTTPNHPLTPTIKELPGPNTTQEPDGLILDSNSVITGFT